MVLVTSGFPRGLVLHKKNLVASRSMLMLGFRPRNLMTGISTVQFSRTSLLSIFVLDTKQTFVVVDPLVCITGSFVHASTTASMNVSWEPMAQWRAGPFLIKSRLQGSRRVESTHTRLPAYSLIQKIVQICSNDQSLNPPKN